MRTRAERIRHKKRVKKNYLRNQWVDWMRTSKHAGMYANHGCTCSCSMCGNPRRWFKERTVQELRAPTINEQLRELFA